jgi:hypothetical protein
MTTRFIPLFASSLLMLLALAPTAGATGKTLLKGTCTPLDGGKPFQLHYFQVTAPGPVGANGQRPAFQREPGRGLDLSWHGESVKVAVPFPMLTNGALLFSGFQSTRTSPKAGHVVLYLRGDMAMIDVQLADNSNKMNTKTPVLATCQLKPE